MDLFLMVFLCFCFLWFPFFSGRCLSTFSLLGGIFVFLGLLKQVQDGFTAWPLGNFRLMSAEENIPSLNGWYIKPPKRMQEGNTPLTEHS